MQLGNEDYSEWDLYFLIKVERASHPSHSGKTWKWFETDTALLISTQRETAASS